MKEIWLDKDMSVPVYSKTCALCKHWDITSPDRVCNAFPDGIPMVIWMGENDHKQPFKGDRGIVFEAITLPSQTTD